MQGMEKALLFCYVNAYFFGIIINMASDLDKADMMNEPLCRQKGEDLRCT